VTLEIRRGEVLGLVGESGSGKSTLGRLALRLVSPDRGRIVYDGHDITLLGPRRLRAFRQAAQIVFQNPDSSLNPRRAVGEAIGRAVTLFTGERGAALRGQVEELLEKVGLPRNYYDRYPHQLSGGEKQRVGVARALAPGPVFIVCDEPVSALDVSVQATVLNLLADLRDGLGLSYLLISHDLAVVAHLADRIAVMYAGRICEIGPASSVLAPPYHPYTEALLSAVAPLGEEGGGKRIILPEEDIGVDKGTGCPFQARCPRKIGEICETVPPPVSAPVPGHTIACHLPLAELMKPTPARRGETR
jgi:peptide/nickel transport system ATP-binding protein